MLILIGIIILLLLILLFKILLQQSKKPAGFIGILMMRLWNKTYLPLVKWTMDFIEVDNYSTILDIGVGNGASSFYLFNQDETLSITGIDISKAAILEAHKRNQQQLISFEIMDIHGLTLDSESFDLVTAFQTHFHWHDLDQAIKEIHRVLKEKGVVVFACEKTKIQYFLPNLKKSADFQTYMANFGFSLIEQNETNQWIFYSFKKLK